MSGAMREGETDALDSPEALRERIRELEAELDRVRHSDHDHRLLLASLPQKAFLKDRASRFVRVNEAFAAEVGASPDELIGKTDFDLYSEDLASKYQADDERVMQSRRTVTLIEHHGVGGFIRYVEVTKAPVLDGETVVGLIGIFADVTARVRAEEERSRQAKLLAEQAKELEERNQELTRAYAELKDAEALLVHTEKMATTGQIVAGLAHEINNPVAFVITNLAAMVRDVDDLVGYTAACDELAQSSGATPEQSRQLRDRFSADEAATEIRGLVDSARGGMQRISRLISTLRDYSRVDSRDNLTMFDLKAGIDSTLVMLRPMRKNDVDLTCELKDCPLIECNGGQINQVLMNLISNAIQAVGTHGEVRVRLDADETGALVEIADNGPGIDPKIHDMIFDPFFTTKGVGEGTGLGLAIARRIVEQHDGRLDFETEIGKGTTFSLRLPLRQRHFPDAPEELDEHEN
ncbi:sensor histidine kinase [Kolteria novifilia]